MADVKGVPLRTQFYNKVSAHVTAPTESVSAKIKAGAFHNSAVGQVIQGSLLDKKPVQDLFERGFGVQFNDKATNIKLSGTKLTSENIEALKKAGFDTEQLAASGKKLTADEIKALKAAGKTSKEIKALQNAKILVADKNLGDLITEKGSAALKKSGFSIETATDGSSKLAAKELSKEEITLLKNSGVSKEVIDKFAKEGATLEKGVMDKLVNTAGKSELEALAKAGGVKIEETATRNIAVGSEGLLNRVAKSGTEKIVGSGFVKKIAGVFSKEIDEKVVESAGKTAARAVGKVGAVGAKGFAGIPVVGALIMGAFEVPSIIKAFKKDGLSGGLAQTGRAVTKVGASLIGGAIGGVIGTVLCPGVGTFIGDAAGGIIGYSVGEKLSNAIFGKPKEDEAATAQTESSESQTATSQSTMLPYMTDMSFMDPTSNPFGGTAARLATKAVH